MRDLELILSFIGTSLGLLVTLATVLFKSSKNIKARRAIERTLEIGDVLMTYIRQAETMIRLNGKEKKRYAVAMTKQYAQKRHMLIDDEFLEKKIEDLLMLTKEVNSRERDQNREICNLNDDDNL